MSADDVRATVANLVHFIDGRRWDELPALFGERVRTDYTSLFGGAPQEQRAAELCAQWRSMLAPLEATQHLLGPIVVALDGDRARAECHVRAEHRHRGDTWMIAGHYRFVLGRAAAGWLIAEMTLDTYFQTGSATLLEEAARH